MCEEELLEALSRAREALNSRKVKSEGRALYSEGLLYKSTPHGWYNEEGDSYLTYNELMGYASSPE